MTQTLRKLARMVTLMLVPALVVFVPTKALASPDFGNRDFQAHLRQDSGLFGGYDRGNRPCPTIRGVPLPQSWGGRWHPRNEWVQYLARTGHPRDNQWRSNRMPDRKWKTLLSRYTTYVKTHRFNDRDHQQVLEYLEQDYYNYWHRQRYDADPPNPRSHSHGFRAKGDVIYRDKNHNNGWNQ